MEDFDPALRGKLASEQIADLHMRMRGVEEAVVALVDAVDHINPALLAETRARFRLSYQETRDRRGMEKPTDQASMLRYLAARLHLLETRDERSLQWPHQDA